ncbi:hypothetical protein AHAS_Ahas13G0338000 [Arachis hypogaea]
MLHIPIIKSHHHLSVPPTHSCKIVQSHLLIFHIKTPYHLSMPQHKISSKIHTIHSTHHKIHSIT